MSPANLLFRWFIEVATLLALGIWAWVAAGGWARPLAAAAVPLGVMALWGLFAVPGDPSRGNAPVPVPGLIRLALELAVFGAAVAALIAVGEERAAGLYAGAVTLHHVIGWRRVRWLLGR